MLGRYTVRSQTLFCVSSRRGEAPARRVDAAAVELMRFEQILCNEVAHGAPAPVQGVLPREFGHEASEVLNLSRMLI